MPGVIDARDEVRLPLGIGPVASQYAARSGQDRLVLRDVLAQRVQVAQGASAAAGQNREEHPRGGRVGDHHPGAGGAGLVQHGMAAVWLDDHDAAPAAGLRQPLQQGHRQGVQAGEDGRVPHQPGPQAAQWLPPQHRRRGQRPSQRRSQGDGTAELVGQRQRLVACAQGERGRSQARHHTGLR